MPPARPRRSEKPCSPGARAYTRIVFLRAGRALLFLSLAAVACLALPAVAGAVTFQAERGALGPSAVKVRDKRAGGGTAVLLVRRAPLSKTLRTPALERVSVRAKASRCGGWPLLAVSIDGRRAATVRVGSRTWRRYARSIRVEAGRHVVRVGLLNPRRARRCTRRLLVDSVTLSPRRPAPRPTIAPQPQPRPAAQPAVDSGPLFSNPVHGAFADPMVLDPGNAHGDYYGYATGTLFPMARSSDLVHWTPAGTAMTARPSWVPQEGQYNPWAPSVIESGQACPGASQPPCFVMFFVGLNEDVNPDANCIGVATSISPGGPYADRGPLESESGTPDASGRPLGCGDDAGYSNIDPAPFVDQDGDAYLYLSTGHKCPSPSPPNDVCPWDRTISVLPLAGDLLEATGPRQQLFASGAAWEANVVEGPWTRRRGDSYELFYSGGVFTQSYGMGAATAAAPTGPFAKSALNPLMYDTADVKGPGGGSLVTGPGGGEWVAYHGRAGAHPLPRLLRLDRVRATAEGPEIDGPTTAPQPVP